MRQLVTAITNHNDCTKSPVIHCVCEALAAYCPRASSAVRRCAPRPLAHPQRHAARAPAPLCAPQRGSHVAPSLERERNIAEMGKTLFRSSALCSKSGRSTRHCGYQAPLMRKPIQQYVFWPAPSTLLVCHRIAGRQALFALMERDADLRALAKQHLPKYSLTYSLAMLGRGIRGVSTSI